MLEPVDWLPDGCAHSPRFDERYSSCSGGVAQALTVFLGGCGLPQGWRGKPSYTVLETGFGMGLNFLTTWALWESDPQRPADLHFISVEGYPVPAPALLRTLAVLALTDSDATPLHARIQCLGRELAAAWGQLVPGINSLQFANGKVRLTLAVNTIGAALPALECVADAVFLDGFSPSVNPDMWSPATLSAVTAHVRPGTTLATYTVARAVRDTLQRLGYTVTRCPGLPPKRDRIRALFTGAATS